MKNSNQGLHTAHNHYRREDIAALIKKLSNKLHASASRIKYPQQECGDQDFTLGLLRHKIPVYLSTYNFILKYVITLQFEIFKIGSVITEHLTLQPCIKYIIIKDNTNRTKYE